MKQVQTKLICSHCLRETIATITYRENSIVEIACTHCGSTTEIRKQSASSLCAAEWEYRLATKPIRLALEMKRDSFHFVSTFPLRVMTKPLRIVQELEQEEIKKA